MKKNKIIALIVFLIALIFPITINAAVINLDNYETKNLEETLEAENIEKEFSNYSEKKDAVTIYMFRGDGCGYCRAFLTFLNSITEEYGDLFVLKSFEVWNDSNNADLLDKMSDITEKPASGVPYIIIGEKVFKGYIADWDEDIINAIKDEAGKKNKFDYFEEYNKSQKQELKGDSTPVIIAVVISATASTIIIVCFQEKNKKEMIRHMNRLYKKSLISKNENQSTASEENESSDKSDEENNDVSSEENEKEEVPEKKTHKNK